MSNKRIDDILITCEHILQNRNSVGVKRGVTLIDERAKRHLYQDLMEIIGEDTTDDNLLPELVGTPAGKAFKLSRNSLRTDLRQALHNYIYGETAAAYCRYCGVRKPKAGDEEMHLPIAHGVVTEGDGRSIWQPTNQPSSKGDA